METTSAFFTSWDQYMYIGGLAFVGIGVLILLYHEFRVLQLSDYKQKFDYVNAHEISYFWYAMMAFIAAAAFFGNTIATETIEVKGMLWFYVRLFIITSLVLIVYFVFFSLIRIYYPKKLARRLVKLRNKPRISPAGNIMRKLSESEEDHHLEESQIAEENVKLVDYDVWIDEQTGYKQIEKYPAGQQFEQCKECGYYTSKIVKEEVEIEPTTTEKGLLVEHYKCSYCGHRERREVVVATRSANVV